MSAAVAISAIPGVQVRDRLGHRLAQRLQRRRRPRPDRGADRRRELRSHQGRLRSRHRRTQAREAQERHARPTKRAFRAACFQAAFTRRPGTFNGSMPPECPRPMSPLPFPGPATPEPSKPGSSRAIAKLVALPTQPFSAQRIRSSSVEATSRTPKRGPDTQARQRGHGRRGDTEAPSIVKARASAAALNRTAFGQGPPSSA